MLVMLVYAPGFTYNRPTFNNSTRKETVHRSRGQYLFPSMNLDLEAQPWVLWVSLALVSVYYTVQTIKRQTTHIMPPGPRGIPFFGSLFQLSATPWKEFETWKAQYGKSIALLNSSGHP